MRSQPVWKFLELLDTNRTSSVGSWLKVFERCQLDSPLRCEEEFCRIYSAWKRNCHDVFPQDHDASEPLSSRLEWHFDPKAFNHSPFSPPSSADLPGFIRNRCDFDIEYDDCAELGLADIEITEEDTPEDLAIKLSCLRAYNDRIKRREEVKNFVMDSNLINIQGQLDAHSCRTAEEIELRAKLRPIERYFEGSPDFDSFVQVILNENRILDRIKYLRQSDSSLPDHPKMEVSTPDTMGDDSGSFKQLQELTQRPFTRSRSGNESKRGRSVEEGCLRVSEALESSNLRDILAGGVDSTESELAGKVGIDPVSFAIIRDLTHRRAALHGSTHIEASFTRFGDILSFQCSL
jgi:hypothetical protein